MFYSENETIIENVVSCHKIHSKKLHFLPCVILLSRGIMAVTFDSFAQVLQTCTKSEVQTLNVYHLFHKGGLQNKKQAARFSKYIKVKIVHHRLVRQSTCSEIHFIKLYKYIAVYTSYKSELKYSWLKDEGNTDLVYTV